MFETIIRWLLSWTPKFTEKLAEGLALDSNMVLINDESPTRVEALAAAHGLIAIDKEDLKRLLKEHERLELIAEKGNPGQAVLVAVTGPKKGKYTPVPGSGTNIVPTYPEGHFSSHAMWTPPTGWEDYFQQVADYAATLVPAQERVAVPRGPAPPGGLVPSQSVDYNAISTTRSIAESRGYSQDEAVYTAKTN